MGDRKQRVAGVDRLRLAPNGPDCLAAVAFFVSVLDIVVDEREVVYKLDRTREGDDLPTSPPTARRNRQREGTQSFTVFAAGSPFTFLPAKVLPHHGVTSGDGAGRAEIEGGLR